jgi:hypothetical protein
VTGPPLRPSENYYHPPEARHALVGKPVEQPRSHSPPPTPPILQELEDLRAAGAPGLDSGLLDAAPDAVAKLFRGAHKAVAAILNSDAPLLYPPGVLALAAFRSGARAAGLGASGFIEHAAARAAAVRAEEEAADGGAPREPIPGGALPAPEHLRAPGGGGGGAQQLLAWMGEVDVLVVAAMQEEEGLEARATEVDRKIKLWRRQAAVAGGGGSGAAAADDRTTVAGAGAAAVAVASAVPDGGGA